MQVSQLNMWKYEVKDNKITGSTGSVAPHTLSNDICHLELCPPGGTLFRSMYTEFFVILPWRLEESVRTCPNMFLKTRRSFVCTHIHSLYCRILCKYHWLCMPLKPRLPSSIHPRLTESVAEIALTIHHSFMSSFYDPNYMLDPWKHYPDVPWASICVCEWHLAPWQKWAGKIAPCVEAFQGFLDRNADSREVGF